MTTLKPFQEATVRAVLAAFRSRRRVKRFLVADEVGLGKTVVAQHVARAMMQNLGRPLIVFYMCSNLAIARQNRRKLLEVLPSEERADADCPIDRLSLLPACEPPSHRSLHLYSLTPDTSIPIRKKHRRDGRQCEDAFVQLEGELRKGHPGSEEARRARLEVEDLLCPIIARTERASHDDGWDHFETKSRAASILGEDLAVFKNLAQSFDEAHRGSAVPYWTSIPLPMQTMGTHYVAWKSAKSVPVSGAPHFSVGMRDRLQQPPVWPHPRLRALRELARPEQLAVPWLPPTAGWWPLRGVWKDADRTAHKLLVFSRFRAVPQAIAASLSYEVEAGMLQEDKLSYSEVTRRRSLSATEKRHPLLGLFHPSPFLIEVTEPLAAKSRDIRLVRREVRRQLKQALTNLGVEIREADSHRRVAARIQHAVLATCPRYDIRGTRRPRLPCLVRHACSLGFVPQSRGPGATRGSHPAVRRALYSSRHRRSACGHRIGDARGAPKPMGTH